MKKTCTFQDIKNMLIECANVNDEITPDSILKTDLGIDSIYAVEMILALEEKFGIQIEMNEKMEILKSLYSSYKNNAI